MSQVTARDAKLHFAKLLKRAQDGEEIVITRDDQPVARLVGQPSRNPQTVRDAVAGLTALKRRLQKSAKPARLTLAQWRSAVKQGRR
jgi:prevent-host-death family protein